jgi:hypothetical protein
MGVLIDLIDRVHDLLGDTTVSRADIRGHVQSLREHAEAVEAAIIDAQAHAPDKAVLAERDRLKSLLDEAWDTNDRLQFEIHVLRHPESKKEESLERPPVVSLTYDQMLISMEAVPPFQQSDVLKSFVGKRVSWSACLRAITNPLESSPDVRYPVYVCCGLLEGSRSKYDQLWCWASFSEANSLANVQQGGLVRVTGTILDVCSLGSTLEDCTFTPEEAQ